MKPYIAINACALFKQHKTGVEWYATQLLKHLAREWKETDLPVMLFAPKNLVQSHPRTEYQNKNWRLKPLPGKHLWTQYRLLKFLKRYPPALLFSPSYVAPRFLPQNIPDVTVVHGLEGEYFPEFKSIKQTFLDYFFTIPALKRSSFVIAVSEHTKKDLHYFYGIPLQKITTVLSGPGTLGDADLRSTTARSASQEKTIKFLFLGGSTERKNLELAVRIFHQLRHLVGTTVVGTTRELSLQIIGDIKNKELQKILASRKKDITLLGYVSEKKKMEYLKSANFLLYPSFYEGFGFPVLEAQACGAVPIVLKGSGLDEVGGEGIIEFDPSDEKKSISQIISYLEDSAKYRNIQQSGRANVKKFSWQKCAQEVKTILLNNITGLNK